jgi:hypothetical protein
MRFRVVICLGLVAASAVACGLSIVGADDDSGQTLPEAGAPRDGGGGGGRDAVPPPVPDPFDGGIDASQDNCVTACGDAGTCDAGWCVISCDGGAECKNVPVTCPPGVPCDVQCIGRDACKQGVDCGDASACNVVCDGISSCANSKVKCRGEACKVTCSQKDACINGVECDAGTCAIRCLEDDTCKNSKVICNADRCTVECGVAGNDGTNACLASVECRAKTSCDVRCLSDNSCKNASVVAVAGETVNVTCAGTNSCTEKVFVGTGDSGVQCLGDSACKNGVSCDGGRCAAHCETSDSYLCCNAATCVPTGNDCTMTSKCP